MAPPMSAWFCISRAAVASKAGGAMANANTAA